VRRAFLIVAMVCAEMTWGPVRASETNPAQARLVAETSGFAPGTELTVGLLLSPDPGWHTYWRDPGAVGLPTECTLKLPAGFKAGPLEWPKPKVFKDSSGFVAYGYDTPVLLSVPVAIPASFREGTLHLKAQATWLVCKDVCLPGKADLSLELPKSQAPQASPEAPLFAEARATVGQEPDGYRPGGSTPDPAVLAAQSASAEEGALPQGKAPVSASAGAGLVGMLALAFVGGLLLNLMPCVLPVLSLKALSFVKQSEQSRSEALAHGLAFGAGVLASFWVLAGTVLALKQGGAAVGWGFQFQQPAFVLFMAALVLAFALNTFGLFEVNLPGAAMQGLSKAGKGQGLGASFGHGLVITLLATPCTAPFLGTALGFAFAASAGSLWAVFTATAVGLALPYVLLAALPSSRKWLPKPGAWMERFKEAMGFLLLATVLWLLWLLGQQVGGEAQADAGLWLWLVALAAWIGGRFGGLTQSRGRRWAMGVLASVLVLGGGAWLWPKVLAGRPTGTDTAPADGRWQPWSESKVRELKAQGRAVFVDFSAQWCWTCKVNENGVLASSPVLEAFRKGKVALLRADWTRQDPAITEALKAHGRSGVPLYLYYPVQGEPQVLPEVLTQGTVLRALEKP